MAYQYPPNIPQTSRARIKAEIIRADQEFADSTIYNDHNLKVALHRYILRIFLVFVEEACALGMIGVWPVDFVEEQCAGYLNFLISTTSDKGAGRYQSLYGAAPGLTNPEDQRELEKSDGWTKYRSLLLEVADKQAKGGIENRTNGPYPWMAPVPERLGTADAQRATGASPEPRQKRPRTFLEPNPTILSGRETVNRKQAAAALGLTLRSIDRLVQDGVLRPTGAWGHKRFTTKDILSFMRSKEKGQKRQTET